MKIKELRGYLKKTQSQFATDVGVSRAIISQIEIGNQRPTLEHVYSIVKKYNIPYEYFFEAEFDVSFINSDNSTISALKIDTDECLKCKIYKSLIEEKDKRLEAMDETLALLRIMAGSKIKKQDI